MVSVTPHTVTLTWTPSTDNVGVVGYEVDILNVGVARYDIWLSTGGQQLAPIGSAPSTSFQLTGLTPDTRYTIGVQAVDTDDNSSGSAFVTFQTSGVPDTTPPTAPGSPSVTAVTDTTVSLAWGASTDDRTPPSYEVYRVVDTGLAFVTSSTTTSATVFSLTPATVYTFVVLAVDAAGNLSARSAAVDVTTQPAPVFACQVRYVVTPGRFGTFSASLTVSNTGTLTWNGWVLTFAFPGNQQLRGGTGATWSQRGQTVTAAAIAGSLVLSPGQSTQLGFTATYWGGNPSPTAFTVNQRACATA